MLKFGYYRLFSSRAEHFKTHIWYFLSLYYLLVEKDLDLYLEKLVSHLPKYALCQVWLKLVKWFWRKRWNMKSWRQQHQTMDKFWLKNNFSIWIRWANERCCAPFTSLSKSKAAERSYFDRFWKLIYFVNPLTRAGLGNYEINLAFLTGKMWDFIPNFFRFYCRYNKILSQSGFPCHESGRTSRGNNPE